MKQKNSEKCIFAVRPLQIVIADPGTLKTRQIIDFSVIVQWGQSMGSPKYFFIRSDNDDIHIFLFKYLDIADYLTNAYINWKLCKSVDYHFCPAYSDVLSFVVNQQNASRLAMMS